MRTSLFWYTKDLRTDDLPALAEAAIRSDLVIPVYIWDEAYLEDEADNRKAFLIECLEVLHEDLTGLGSGLTVRYGSTAKALIDLCSEHKASAVYCALSRDPQLMNLQKQVRNAIESHGIMLQAFSSNFLIDPTQVRSQTGSVYRVFTPFKKAVLCTMEIRPRANVPENLISARLESIYLRPHLRTSPERQFGGSSRARRSWIEFKQRRIAKYHDARNDLANQATSKLSAHLNFGTISVHTLARDILTMDDPITEQGRASFLTELLWREFNSYIAHHFPEVTHRAFRDELSLIKWPGTSAQFDTWRNGMTGYPIVDAAMRQLKQTGWMHNRARMIVASFLVKDLLVNWQEGEAHFMDRLTDGDQVQNNAGWQWSASTGVDAQPFFRIFNPVSQGKKFDPTGEYVRRYVPELRQRSTKFIHDVNVNDASQYPKAIVDHATQRKLALEMFKQAMTKYRQ